VWGSQRTTSETELARRKGAPEPPPLLYLLAVGGRQGTTSET